MQGPATSASLPLAGGVPIHARLRSLPRAWMQRLPARTAVAGDTTGGGALAVVESGAVVVESVTRSGGRAALLVLGPGDILGGEHLAWTRDLDRRGPGDGLAAYTLVGTRILWLPPPSGLAPWDDPDLAAWAIGALAATVEALQRALVRTLAGTARERVLELLRDLAGSHGRVVPGGRMIRVPVSQDLLAAMTGVTRETVNRALSSLRREGIVRRIGRRYLVEGEAYPVGEGR